MSERWKVWRTRREQTRSIHGYLSLGPCQFKFHLHLHGHAYCGPRLVFQRSFILDLPGEGSE